MAITYDELKIRHVDRFKSETVLVMQGGGSLGAYECGVYKTLCKNGISFDVVAGTSIGAVNAGIIAGAKSGEDPAKVLENFWLEIADTVTPSFDSDYTRAFFAASRSAMYGNARVFLPTWIASLYGSNPSKLFAPLFNNSNLYGSAMPKTPYLYSIDPLKKTLEKYIDFDKFNGEKKGPRLIVTCTDIKTSDPIVFDSLYSKIDAESLVACAGFPFYGIAWTEKDGRYLWDGSLLSNTPLREVIDASPKHDKFVYIVSLFPHHQDTLPENMADTWHRARDILHTDRTDQDVKMSKVVTKYLLLLKEMHDILVNAPLGEELMERFLAIERKYHKIAEERGAVISDIIKIERSEDIHFIFEDADFSSMTIKKLIRQGEQDAENALARRKERKGQSDERSTI
jgi:NTE family protein